KAFIEKPHSFFIAEDHDFEEQGDEEETITEQKGNNAVLDQALYDRLKELTRKVAREKDVPPYAVFQENSLNEMAINYPTTIDDLKNISGVGEGKAKKFGKPFIELIKSYVEEN